MELKRNQERPTLRRESPRSTCLAAIAFSLVAISLTSNASECDYAKNEFDPFTKQRLVATNSDRFTESADDTGIPSASVSAIIEGEQHFLVINLRLAKMLGYEPSDTELRDFMVIPKGAKLLVLMTDGSIVELRAHNSVRAKSRSSEAHGRSYDGAPYQLRYKINSSTSFRYPLNADIAAALSAQSATHVRLSTSDGDLDLKVHRRPFANFKRAIDCIHPDQLPDPA